MAVQIAVIGAGSCDEAIAQNAYEVGQQIARAGAVLLCGGLGGVMEAACRGAKDAGGVTIGIVPGADRHSANPYVDHEIVTNAGHARNVFLAHSADAMIAVSGSHGTLSEIAIGLKLGKPVIGLGSWEIRGILSAQTAKQAVSIALEQLD